jgi:HSP20 family protein
LPETVDAEKIEASFKNGVLKVTPPKKPEAQKPTKKIEVKGV